MAKVYLALGSNLGDRLFYLKNAILHLPTPCRLSRIYETEPVDAPEGSSPFLNAIVEFDFEPDSLKLLSLVNQLESAAQRVRDVKNGPRTLDADVVYVDGLISDDPLLTLPHPRAAQRGFVIAPLMDLNEALAFELNPSIASSIKLSDRERNAEVCPGVVLFADTLH